MTLFIFKEVNKRLIVKVVARDIKEAIKKVNKRYPGKIFEIELDKELGDKLMYETHKK